MPVPAGRTTERNLMALTTVADENGTAVTASLRANNRHPVITKKPGGHRYTGAAIFGQWLLSLYPWRSRTMRFVPHHILRAIIQHPKSSIGTDQFRIFKIPG